MVSPHKYVKFWGTRMTNVVGTALIFIYIAQFFQLRQIPIPANQAQLLSATWKITLNNPKCYRQKWCNTILSG